MTLIFTDFRPGTRLRADVSRGPALLPVATRVAVHTPDCIQMPPCVYK